MANELVKAHASRYVVAVSGGVDSVVLLDMLLRHGVFELVVAHVDHGIRGKESADDAKFVKALAAKHNLPYEHTRLRLGAHTSEDKARQARYNFLYKVARKYQGPIITAHHADDVVETIAINFTRGTGWRGLACLNTPGIYRPLTTHFKSELVAYAKRHNLEWREDSTNKSDKYLRNRIRQKAAHLPIDTKLQLLALWRTQKHLASEIDAESRKFTTYKRYFYIMASPRTAREVLAVTLALHDVSLTRPQLDAVLLAIRTARRGAKRSLGAQATLVCNLHDFAVVTRKK